MNNRNKILILAGFLVVLTGLLSLEVWRKKIVTDETIYDVSRARLPLIFWFESFGHTWTFESKGLVFGLAGDKSLTFIVFANHYFWIPRNFFVVASALVIIPALYAVVFSWIIILRRRMKAQSPGAGSAERPDH